jgi:hypothetical protein
VPQTTTTLNPSSCDGHEDGYLFADTKDCAYFYECAYGIAFRFACPSGLLYNPYEQQCDYPSNVNCGGGGVNITTAGPGGVKTTTTGPNPPGKNFAVIVVPKALIYEAALYKTNGLLH